MPPPPAQSGADRVSLHRLTRNRTLNFPFITQIYAFSLATGPKAIACGQSAIAYGSSAAVCALSNTTNISRRIVRVQTGSPEPAPARPPCATNGPGEAPPVKVGHQMPLCPPIPESRPGKTGLLRPAMGNRQGKRRKPLGRNPKRNDLVVKYSLNKLLPACAVNIN
jgi:hypothetical protein